MTLDVKALRAVSEADRVATARFEAGPTRENFDAAMLAREAYLGAVPSVLVLALLDRLERAEAKLLETREACESVYAGWLDDGMSAGDLARELRAISDDLRRPA